MLLNLTHYTFNRCSLELLSIVPLQLLDTKSTDRKLTLLHYIANVVKEKYVQVSLFYNELHYVEKAAAGESRGAEVVPRLLVIFVCFCP